MTANDKSVLTALADTYDCEFGDDTFFAFAAIERRTGLSRRDVRLSCRRLTRRGLARFSAGLWNGDGEPRGSGYGITAAGRALISESAP